MQQAAGRGRLPGAAAMRCPSVVGRDREQALLAAAVERARAGTGSVLVLVGDAGIGKSALARWLVGTVGGPRLAGRAARPPSPGLRALAELTLSAVDAGVDVHAPDLDFYRPALRALLPGAVGPRGEAPPDSLVVGHAVLEVVGRVPSRGPRVAVVEDLHWADVETRLALEPIVELVHERNILLVLTARQGESAEVDQIVDRWVESRLAEVVRLRALTRAEVETMIGLCLAGAIPGGLVDTLFPVVDGSPLLVEDLLDSLVDAGDLVLADGAWAYRPQSRLGVPQTFAAAVRRQLSSLSSRDRAVLQSAAMVGRLVNLALLERMGHAPSDVAGAVAAGLAARLLSEGSELAGTAFRHALTEAAVVSVMMDHERRALARTNLAALEGTGPAVEDLDAAAALARQAGETGREVAHLLRSAEHAVALGNPAAALTKLDEAAAAAGPDIERIRAIEALRLLAASQGGDVVAARALARRLLPGLEGAGNDAARYRARLALARAEGASGNWSNAAGALPDLEAEGLAPDLLSFGAVVAWERGDALAARSLAERARLLAAQAESGPAECEALEVLGRLARSRSYHEAAAIFTEAVRVAERHGLGLWRARGLFELGLCDATTTKDGTNFELARAAAVDAGALGFSAVVDYCTAHLFASGFETERALVAARRGLTTAQRLRLPTWESRLHVMIGMAHAGAGQRGEARAAGEAARAAAAGDVEVEALDWGVCRGFASLVVEDRLAAVEEYGRCLDLFESLEFRTATMPWYDMPILGAVADPEGLGARAVAAIRASPETLSAVEPWLPLADAVLAGRAGDGPGATALVEAVLAMERELARDRARWGRVDVYMRLVGEAALRDGWGKPLSWLAEADAGLRARGVTTVADACRALLRDAGAGPRRRPDQMVPAMLAELGVTRREVEVLRMLIERRTNRQIADRLVISPRTVKSHIEHLLAKTGRTDRHELADAARAAGVTVPAESST